jgi:outer membrane protein OmpU
MGRDDGGRRAMKRVLYATTALVVAGLTAGNASAASGLKLGITGFFRNAIGASWGNGPQATFPAATGFSTAGLNSFGRQDVSMRQEIRVNFTGETTLDNGITVGVLVG